MILTGPFSQGEASRLDRSLSIAHQGPTLLSRDHHRLQHASAHSLSPIMTLSTTSVQRLMIHRPGVWSAQPALIMSELWEAKSGCIAEIMHDMFLALSMGCWIVVMTIYAILCRHVPVAEPILF